MRMSVPNPYEAYQQNAVSTASPGELTLMLYEGCLKFINLAKADIEKIILRAKIGISRRHKISLLSCWSL